MPGYDPGMGTGHLFRSIRLALAVSAKQAGNVSVVCRKDHPVLSLFPEAQHLVVDPAEFSVLLESPADQAVSSVPGNGDGAPARNVFFFDYPRLSEEQVLHCRDRGAVMALDPGGPGRKHVPYIVDTLPNLFAERNIASPWFLGLPQRKRIESLPVGNREPDGTRLRNNAKPFRVLVSLGGEDGQGLTLSLMQNPEIRRWFTVAQVDVLLGPSFRKDAIVSAVSGSWKLLAPIPNLVDRLAEYDLVVTIFGLTAFEALALGTPVLLEHPTVYHRKLGDLAGFLTISKFILEFPRLEDGLPVLMRQIEEFQKTRPEPGSEVSLDAIAIEFANAAGHKCPACGSTVATVTHRFEDRSFLLCRECKINFQIRAKQLTEEYGPEYFEEDYKRQYGKTYLEDFDSIRARGAQRLKHIDAVRQVRTDPSQQRLFEIGCAFGPFLAEAAERGYQVFGIDVNKSSVDYVTAKLGRNARHLSWRDIDTEDDPFRHGFEIICLWYVIEHFPDLEDLLRLVAKLLRPGGVLAFSTPSGQGIDAIRRGRAFWADSPQDHFTVWNPSMTRKLLRRYGFKVKRILPASFHPERFPGALASKFLRPLTRLFNRVFQLGDTMEVYATRIDK